MTQIIFPKVDLNNVSGVMIDVDNTLYAYTPAHVIALDMCYEYVCEHFPLKMSYEEFIARFNDSRKKVIERLTPQGACRSRLLTFQNMAEELLLTKAYLHGMHLEHIYWSNFNKHIVPSPVAVAFLKECKTRKIPVCAVTNMTSIYQILKIQALGLESYITYMVTSEESGVEKPDPLIYKMALAKLGCEVHEAIMVGDDYKNDIEGAESLGIKAYQVEADEI